MNKLWLMAILFSASRLLAAPAVECASPDPATQARISQLHERDSQASKSASPEARAAILELLTDDVVMIPPGSAPVFGKTAWGKVLETTDASASDWVIDSYVETYPEIVVCGDLAYEWGTITTVAHDQKTGRQATQVGNSMRILKRAADGGWLIHRAIFNSQSTH